MPGTRPAGLDRGAQALVGVGRRHADVDDRDVGAVRLDRATRASPSADGGHDLAAGLLEQAHQALAQQHRVLGEDYPHGTSAVGPRWARRSGLSTGELAVDRGDPVRQPGKAVALGGVRAAAAVVDRRPRPAGRRGRAPRPARAWRRCAWRRWPAPRRRRSRRRARTPRDSRGPGEVDVQGRPARCCARPARPGRRRRPRSTSTEGAMPRPRARSSSSVSRACSRAPATSVRAASGSVSMRRSAARGPSPAAPAAAAARRAGRAPGG